MQTSIDFASLSLAPAPDWPSERQRAFLIALARTGNVAVAARQVGATQSALHKLRRDRGKGSNFSRAWRQATTEARFDALATSILRKIGSSDEQLARLDARFLGRDKARFTLELFMRSRRGDTARRIR